MTDPAATLAAIRHRLRVELATELLRRFPDRGSFPTYSWMDLSYAIDDVLDRIAGAPAPLEARVSNPPYTPQPRRRNGRFGPR